MYAPPAVGYSLIVSRYERIRKKSTPSIATVTPTTRLNAAAPTATKRTRRISSVAYADEEMQSDENTASATGMPRRSCSSWSVASGGAGMRPFPRGRRASGGGGGGGG